MMTSLRYYPTLREELLKRVSNLNSVMPELYIFESTTFVLIFWHILDFKVQWFETNFSNPSLSDLVLSRIGSFKSTSSYFRKVSFVMTTNSIGKPHNIY